jgi:hypothetical protein
VSLRIPTTRSLRVTGRWWTSSSSILRSASKTGMLWGNRSSGVLITARTGVLGSRPAARTRSPRSRWVTMPAGSPVIRAALASPSLIARAACATLVSGVTATGGLDTSDPIGVVSSSPTRDASRP